MKAAIFLLLTLLLASQSYAQRELLIAEVFYDTPLNESTTNNLPTYNGEYIKLANVSSHEIDLSEYELLFRIDHYHNFYSYCFPEGASLQPRGFAIVYYQYDSNFSFEDLFTLQPDDSAPQLFPQRNFYMANLQGELKLRKQSKDVDILKYGTATGLLASNGEGRSIEECKAIHRDFYYTENHNGNFYTEEYSSQIAAPYSMKGIERKGTADENYLWWNFNAYKIGSAQHNYIAQAFPIEARDTEMTISKMLESVEYFDGFGRSIETVNIAAGGNGNDIVNYCKYNHMGNIEREYIPSPVIGNNNGAYISPTDYASNATNFFGSEIVYREYFYDNTASERQTEYTAEGTAWHSHNGCTTEYYLNTASGELACVRYIVDATDGQLSKVGNHPISTLRVVKTTDEDGITILTFKDFLDRTILIRQISEEKFADTYYVYDNYGQVAYILPPELSERLKNKTGDIHSSDELMENYAFMYTYDNRNRCIGKKLPGADWIKMRYDNSDLLIASENGNQRQKGEYTAFAYDQFGRLAYSATVNGTIGEADSQQRRTSFNSNGQIYGYECVTATPETQDILTVCYYDNYDFINNFSVHRTQLEYRNKNGFDCKFESALNTKSSSIGMMTGKITALTDGSGIIIESLYYDHAGRTIQRHSTNHLGGYEHTYLALTFTGKTAKELHEHTTSTNNIATTILQEFEYDQRDRLIKITHKINDNETRVLLCNTYNELGQLVTSKMGNADNIYANYSYNIRGWLNRISSTHFDQNLFYEKPINGIPRYNGNISMDLTSRKPSRHSQEIDSKRYFTYDGFGRLIKSEYREEAMREEPVDRPVIYLNEPQYSTLYSYDLNSNIISLQREGLISSIPLDENEGAYRQWNYGVMDDLTITLNGNQLKKVTDSAEEVVYANAFEFNDATDLDTEYEYDYNGNMTVDKNRRIIKIDYDINNRPKTVEFGGTKLQRTKYIYDAVGNKLQTSYQYNRFAIGTGDWGGIEPHDSLEIHPGIGEGSGIIKPQSGISSTGGIGNIINPGITIDPWTTEYSRDYCGNIIYKDGKIERILTDCGYAVPNADSSGYTYYYYIKDYQGNVRGVHTENENEPYFVEYNDYYPYGMPFADNYTGSQPYKYGGKELDRANGLDMLDFHARWHDPITARFTTIDEKAETNPDISPYIYCAGNPIRYIDPDGKMPALIYGLIKGFCGAIIDVGAQVTVGMDNGDNFEQAISKIDYTSVGASFVTSAIATPAMSTTAKVAKAAKAAKTTNVITGVVITADAAVDISEQEGFQIIGGNKSITNAAVDAVFSTVPGKVVDNAKAGFNKAVTSDLKSNTAATLTKETRASLKQAQETVNSLPAGIVTDAITNYPAGVLSGQINTELGKFPTGILRIQNPLVQPNDATRIQRTVIPLHL